MDVQEFSHVLDEVKPITDYIYLHVQGEPLLHPQFETLMTIADEKQMQVQLVTNGTLLNQYPDLFEHPSLRRLSVSMQSVSYQPKENIKDYLDVLERLMHKASVRERPFMELRFWRSDELENEQDSYCLSWLEERYSFRGTKRNKSLQILPHVFVSFANEFEWPSENGTVSETSGTCLGARDQIAVLSDGSVVPCCLDANAHILLGNLRETSLSSILETDRYLRMRDGFRNGRVAEPFCQSCTYRLRFGKNTADPAYLPED